MLTESIIWEGFLNIRFFTRFIFVFLIDVDVMPSLGIREGFNDFANRHQDGLENISH